MAAMVELVGYWIFPIGGRSSIQEFLYPAYKDSHEMDDQPYFEHGTYGWISTFACTATLCIRQTQKVFR